MVKWVKISALMLLGINISMCGNDFLRSSDQSNVVSQAATLTTAQQIAKINASLSTANKQAKAWIAARESGGSYTARNGNCYGRYQLLNSYLHGNYSAVNQEKTANEYVKSRYGSWVKAKKFWQAHYWY